jgi:flagellar hook-associated protein 1 FlgK
MRSTFFGLNIGYKGLSAQQRALDVTSHNVANANTEGYTRQDVIMQASRPLKILQGYVGTGVDVIEFRRIREEFLDIQMRTENRALGEWETKANILSKLEVVFNEPSDTSMRSSLDQFWESWQVLSKNPESVAARTTVMQRGVTLANTFNHMDTQFFDLQVDINKGIGTKIKEVNSIGTQVGDLNAQIIKAEAEGHKANDLRDRRDLLLERLSGIVAIDVVEDELGAVNVTVGGKFLVARTIVSQMRFIDNPLNPTQAKLEWYDPHSNLSQGEVRLSGGVLKGYVDMRDEVIPNYQDKVSLLARKITEEVNTLHRQGYALDKSTDRDFFTVKDISAGMSARNIRVNQEIMDNINLIATASQSTPDVYQGDGSNALLIAQLKNKLTMNDGVASFDDFYRSTVGQLGVEGQEAQQMAEGRSYLMEQLINQRESVSGVSLDEEMTNMIKYQHAYSAAARVINVMDEMLELIVNRLGMVGR